MRLSIDAPTQGRSDPDRDGDADFERVRGTPDRRGHSVVVAGVLDGEPMLVHLLEDPVATGSIVGTAEGEARAARSAEVVISPNRPADSDAGNVPALSPREVQVLRLVALGRETSWIAEELGVSPHTALNHIRNIRQKLGVATKLAAVVSAIRLGIIRVD